MGVGPVLFRAAKELCGRVCLLSVLGFERGLLIHAVEPWTLSVSVLPLGEAELRNLDPPELLARWLGKISLPHRHRLTRAEWATVAEWLLDRLVLEPARVVRGPAVEVLDRHFVVSISAPGLETDDDDDDDDDDDESEDIDVFSRNEYGRMRAAVDADPVPIASFGVNEYARLRATALAISRAPRPDPERSPPTVMTAPLAEPRRQPKDRRPRTTPTRPRGGGGTPVAGLDRTALGPSGGGGTLGTRLDRTALRPSGGGGTLGTRLDRIEAALLEKLAARAA